jgi:hypothetical protein
MNERQTDFERSGRPIWLLLTIDAFSAQDFTPKGRNRAPEEQLSGALFRDAH